LTLLRYMLYCNMIENLSKRTILQFNRTIEEAKALKGRNSFFRCFHWSTIYKGKRLISASFNLAKTNPRAIKYYPPWTYEFSLHAEFSAIIKGGLFFFWLYFIRLPY